MTTIAKHTHTHSYRNADNGMAQTALASMMHMYSLQHDIEDDEDTYADAKENQDGRRDYS